MTRLAAVLVALILLAAVVWLIVSLWHRGTAEPEPVEVRALEVIEKFPPATFPTTPTTTNPVRAVMTATARSAPIVIGTGACGGDLPPCWVMRRESGGNINAYNPTGCQERDKSGRVVHQGCRGKWQCSYSTCSGTGTEEEQDAEARALWDGGRGCSHWAAC